MIVGCNNNINTIIYSGYTITKVYACGGELVYSAQTQPVQVCDDHKLKYKYQGGDWQYREYNGNYTLNCYDTDPSNCTGQVTTIISSTGIGKCVNAIDDYTLRGAGIMTIPSEVAWIGGYALADNGNSVITFKGLQPPIIQNTTFSNTTGKIIVPCEAKNRYKAAWPSLSSRISATTTACTQLEVISGDGTYDYIELDSTHKGSFNLDLTTYTNPKIEISMMIVDPTSGGEWIDSQQFFEDKTNNWSAAVKGYSVGFGRNGSYDRSFSNNYVGATKSMVVNSNTINYGTEYYNANFGLGNIIYGNSSSNAHIKLFSVKVYTDSTLLNNGTLYSEYVPFKHGDRVGLFDTIHHRIIFMSGSPMIGNA